MAPRSQTFPEFILATRSASSRISRAVAAGKLRKIGPRLYASNLSEPVEELTRRKGLQIAALYFPGGLVSDRTALILAPAEDGSIFLISPRGGEVALPGLRLRPRRGVGPLPGDFPLRDGLLCCSTARALLENMRPSRAKGGAARTLNRKELEAVLDKMIRSSGVEGMNRLRDAMRSLAPALDMKVEFEHVSGLIGALLGTRDDETVSPEGAARRRGQPFDPKRVVLFQTLATELQRLPPDGRPDVRLSDRARINRAFFESYFSNFIEGTEFEVGEAKDIVFKNIIPQHRPNDAHDVRGTFEVVSNLEEMGKVPASSDGFERILRERHRVILGSRPEMNPGAFKSVVNRAGNTVFVLPEDVAGTLREGFRIYQHLTTPSQRAIFMMFLVAEVHPFADGNGRLARVMMNAELVSAGEVPIIIPIIFRNNYLAALRALSLNGNAEPLVKTLLFAQKYTAMLRWETLDGAEEALQWTNAFIRPDVGEENGITLKLPRVEQLA